MEKFRDCLFGTTSYESMRIWSSGKNGTGNQIITIQINDDSNVLTAEFLLEDVVEFFKSFEVHCEKS
jgi:hypothetical protein